MTVRWVPFYICVLKQSPGYSNYVCMCPFILILCLSYSSDSQSVASISNSYSILLFFPDFYKTLQLLFSKMLTFSTKPTLPPTFYTWKKKEKEKKKDKLWLLPYQTYYFLFYLLHVKEAYVIQLHKFWISEITFHKYFLNLKLIWYINGKSIICWVQQPGFKLQLFCSIPLDLSETQFTPCGY